MEVGGLAFAVVGTASFGVSLLTLFSGFGLGTLLLPAFALFFPVEVAVAATAVVHGANNIFKLGLLRADVDGKVALRFGLPAVAAAFPGALLLVGLAAVEPLGSTELLGARVELHPAKLVIGALVLLFAVQELAPGAGPRIGVRWLPLGGALSGFFGGLSGHQGALRAAFLAPLGLSPAAFAATQAALACCVDVARLAVYGAAFPAQGAALSPSQWRLVAAACVCAFGGALLGRRLLPTVTVAAVRRLTGMLLLGVGAGLASGLL